MVLEVPLIIRYSHCSNRCRVPVRCLSISGSVIASSNKVMGLFSFTKNDDDASTQ